MTVINMGKNFRKELEEIPNTYATVLREDVSAITNFLDRTVGTPILLIGSGGSFSVAMAAEYLLRRAGLFCKAITPLELPQYKNQLLEVSAILLTAGGRNPDTQNTYQYLSEMEIQAILTLCMSKNAPISQRQRFDLHSAYCDFSVPCGKDGYLAVNSTIASIALISKAIFEFTNDSFYSLPEDFPSYDGNRLERDQALRLFNKETIIVLHGGITTPVAYDLESKFSEVALGNIQLVDFRNFAHGRHYWISNRGKQTAVLLLIGEKEHLIAEKTKTIIEDCVVCESLILPNESSANLLGLYAKMFELVALAGDMLNLDPGCPKVADFGRKLYHLSYNPCTAPNHRKLKKSIVYAGAQRKTRTGHYLDFNAYLAAANAYISALQRKQFRGIIFDYDGTLHEKRKGSLEVESEIFAIINDLLQAGIYVGIATGRGKSVRKELQLHIRKEYWHEVAIGYYNGGCIASLADNFQPDVSQAPFWELQLAKDVLERLRKDDSVQIELRPLQLTITSNQGHTLKAYMELCREHIRELNNIKVVESSHSVDVIPITTTKQDIVRFFENSISTFGCDFLFVGDSGQWGGNDYEMLCMPYSLSVDMVSRAADSCWNFAPLGIRNTAAALFYLKHLSLVEETSTFYLKLI